MDIVSPIPRSLPAGDSIASRMESNYAEPRAASPSTFTLSKGRNNRLSFLSGSSTRSVASSLEERTRSPPPSYDGHVMPDAASPAGQVQAETDISATLDAHLPLPQAFSNKGWSEVNFVSKQLLAENLPGWMSSMQEPGGPKATGPQKHLSQLIKAGVRKSHKGLVLRLLRRTPEADEIADLRFDPAHETAPPSPGPAALSELEAIPPKAVVHQLPGIHEAPNEPPVYELPTSNSTPRPAAPDTPVQRPATVRHDDVDDTDAEQIQSPTSPTEAILRTLSFGPEEELAWSAPVIDNSDSDHSPSSSIVPTPTKGLSVRKATCRVIKRKVPGDGDAACESGTGESKLSLDVDSINRKLLDDPRRAGDMEESPVSPSDSTDTERDCGSRQGSAKESSGNVQGTGSAVSQSGQHAEAGPSKVVPKDPAREGSFVASAYETEAKSSIGNPKVVVPNPKFLVTPDSPPISCRPPLRQATPEPGSSSTAVQPSVQNQVARTVKSSEALEEKPVLSPKLTISTDCGPTPKEVFESVERPSSTRDLVPTRQPAQTQQETLQPSTPLRNNDQIRTPIPSLQEAQGGNSEDTIQSVTMPTLNLPEPESPGGSMWLPSNLEIRPTPERRNPLFSLASHASRAVLSQIGSVVSGVYDTYGPERPVPKDHVRVRWTCTCGKQLYDDFIERRRGAARELEAYLNRPRSHTAPSSPSHSANSSFSEPSQIFSSNGSLSPSPATTWSSMGGGDLSPSNYSPTTLRSNNPFSVRVGTLPPPRWLLTCADEGQFTTKLSHVDVTETKVRSDRDLAMAVRGLYSHVNRKWWRLLRLRGITSIEFVQFEVHRNRVVDIRKCPDMPPKQTGYDFEPHDLVPPVGAQYLLHLFQHPEDYDNEFITYARAPKKRASRLDVGVGWGIHLVEGFLADRVWALVTGFFVLGSTVFAIVWASRRGDDVQGAFGVASWMLTLAVLFVGWAQAAYG